MKNDGAAASPKPSAVAAAVAPQSVTAAKTADTTAAKVGSSSNASTTAVATVASLGSLALLSQSAIACYRAEYMAALAMAVGGVGEQLSRAGIGGPVTAAVRSRSKRLGLKRKTKTDETVAPAEKKVSTARPHARRRRTEAASSSSFAASASPLLLCAELKRHYASHLRGGLARAPERPPAPPVVSSSLVTSPPCDPFSGVGERVFAFSAPSPSIAEASFTSTDAACIGAKVRAEGFRPDDVVLFNGPPFVPAKTSKSARAGGGVASPAAGGPSAPIESLTKLVLESQLTLKRLSIPPMPASAASPTGSCPASPLSPISVAASPTAGAATLRSLHGRRRGVAEASILARRSIDRALGNATIGRAAARKQLSKVLKKGAKRTMMRLARKRSAAMLSKRR